MISHNTTREYDENTQSEEIPVEYKQKDLRISLVASYGYSLHP